MGRCPCLSHVVFTRSTGALRCATQAAWQWAEFSILFGLGRRGVCGLGFVMPVDWAAATRCLCCCPRNRRTGDSRSRVGRPLPGHVSPGEQPSAAVPLRPGRIVLRVLEHSSRDARPTVLTIKC